MAEEEVEVEAPAQALSADTGLFYLYYQNDSGREVSSNARNDVDAEFFARMDAAASSAAEEHVATLSMQAAARRALSGRHYSHHRSSAISVERVYQGHRGRLLVYEEAQLRRDAGARAAFWNANAIQVQKMWKGFLSRKHQHNFYLRKAYLDSVADRGQALRSHLAQHHSRLTLAAEEAAVEARLDKFEGVVSSLHHMLSTTTIRGVYNSPYQHLAPQTAFGLPIETHLKNVSKGTLRQTIEMRTGIGQGKAHRSSSPQVWKSSAPPTGAPSQSAAGLEAGGGSGVQLYAFSTKPIKISRAH